MKESMGKEIIMGRNVNRESSIVNTYVFTIKSSKARRFYCCEVLYIGMLQIYKIVSSRRKIQYGGASEKSWVFWISQYRGRMLKKIFGRKKAIFRNFKRADN